jgi:regulator of replication initiation timing
MDQLRAENNRLKFISNKQLIQISTFQREIHELEAELDYYIEVDTALYAHYNQLKKPLKDTKTQHRQEKAEMTRQTTVLKQVHEKNNYAHKLQISQLLGALKEIHLGLLQRFGPTFGYLKSATKGSQNVIDYVISQL